MITKDQSYNVGQLNKRVTVQYPTSSGDGMGGQTSITWNDLVTVWADISPTSGEESFDQQALQQNLTHRIVTRYREDLTDYGYTYDTYDGELRVKYSGRTFNVKSAVNRGEEERYVELQCQEEVRA